MCGLHGNLFQVFLDMLIIQYIIILTFLSCIYVFTIRSPIKNVNESPGVTLETYIISREKGS